MLRRTIHDHTSTVCGVLFSPKGKYYATIGSDTYDYTVVGSMENEDYGRLILSRLIAFTRDDASLVYVMMNGNVNILNLGDGPAIQVVFNIQASFLDLALSPNDQFVALATRELHAQIWSLQTKQRVHDLG
jgi:WD40 repeat protein